MPEEGLLRDPLLVLAVLCGIVFLAKVLEQNFSFAKKLTPVVLILIISAVCSNLRFIPFSSDEFPFYGNLIGNAVPFAVCLVLFTINLSDLKKAGLPMLIAFGIASIGTFVGAVVGALVLSSELGADTWKLTAPFTGTYIGGSLNFSALWEGFMGKPEGAAFGAANAVDNLTALPFFLFMLIVPMKLMHLYPVAGWWKRSKLNVAEGEESITGDTEPAKFNLFDVSALIFCAVVIMWVSSQKLIWLWPGFVWKFPTGFKYIVLTTLALLFAHIKFISKREGASELGNYAFYLFFAGIGATCDIEKAVKLAPMLFLFVSIIIGIHIIFVFGFGRLLGIDIRVLACASMAAKSGPPTVLALTNVKGWKDFALPGVAVGLLGYAIGNYLGWGAAHLVKFLLGA